MITLPNFLHGVAGKKDHARCSDEGQGVIPDTMTFGEVTVIFPDIRHGPGMGKIELTPREDRLLRLFVEHKGSFLPEITSR